MDMLKFCRACRGNSVVVLKKSRCPLCKKNKQNYIDDGRLAEVNEMEWLYSVWDKCRRFKQISTGFKKLDQLITRLFGDPHKDCDVNGLTWRNYKLLAPRCGAMIPQNGSATLIKCHRTAIDGCHHSVNHKHYHEFVPESVVNMDEYIVLRSVDSDTLLV